ncbi:MAG: hypothetical protein ACQEQV_10240, partial [Fibrobacterota bacterium]
RLSYVRRLTTEDFPLKEVDSPLPGLHEPCYFSGDGRLLKKRVIDRFQRNGVRHTVRGFVNDREGTLAVTPKEVLLIGGGRTKIPLKDILDLEVDWEQQLLVITRSNRKNPVYLTTPRALTAAAVVERLISRGA